MLLFWSILAVVWLFNTQQLTSSVFQKDTLNPGQYTIRVHTNAPIVEANTNYWTCNYSGQNAVCKLNITQAVSKVFLSTIKLGERNDKRYVIDYSASDSAVKPEPSIIDTQKLTETVNPNAATTTTVTKPVSQTKLAAKKTGLTTNIVLALLAIILITTWYMIKKRNI